MSVNKTEDESSKSNKVKASGESKESIQPAKKITFEDIFKDFGQRHPHLKKDALHWSPLGYMTIEICMKDGMLLKYDGEDHKATVIRRPRG